MDKITKKYIFEQKLKGEPINIMVEQMNDLLGNDVCLLLSAGIFEDPVGQYSKFICRYPVRIWHGHKGNINKVNSLQPGNIWQFGRDFK